MKQEYKTPWLAALRSGDYKQGGGRGVLRLEVLTDIEEVWDYEYGALGVLLEVTGSPISHGYVRSFGISPAEECELMLMDDKDNFNTIADYIEENL